MNPLRIGLEIFFPLSIFYMYKFILIYRCWGKKIGFSSRLIPISGFSGFILYSTYMYGSLHIRVSRVKLTGVPELFLSVYQGYLDKLHK